MLRPPARQSPTRAGAVTAGSATLRTLSRFLTAALDYPDYDPASPLTPLTGAELGQLDTLLQTLRADGVMSLDGMDGYLTALLSGPGDLLKALPTADWLPWVWGGDGEGGSEDAHPFASKRQKKASVVLLLRHLRHIDHQLRQTPDTWEPIFSVAEQGADEWADARDWCTGFLQAVDLLPSAWEAAWEEPALGPALAPLLLLGGGLDAAAGPGAEDTEGTREDDDLDDPATCDGLSRAVPDAVLRLRAWRDSAARS